MNRRLPSEASRLDTSTVSDARLARLWPTPGRTRVALSIKIREIQGVTVLELEGDFTLPSGYASLRERIKQLLADQRKKIVIDLARVAKIDSGGLGVLVEALVSVRKWSGELKLAHVSEQVRKLFLLTNLETFFEMYPTEEEARASFH